jgi:hypothetical protein
VALIILAVVVALLFGAYEWLLITAQSTLRQRLNEHGMSLTYRTLTWSPWGGITLSDAVLRGLPPENKPLVEISALHVGMLWHEAWQARSAITRWFVNDATLTLNDPDGAVTLQHFSTDFSMRANKIDIASLGLTDGPATVVVKGQITAATTSGASADQVFKLDLKPLRSVLDTLDFKPGSGAFAITGSFMLDLRPAAVEWSADLHGTGSKVEWRGVPMQQAAVDAQLSQTALKVAATLTLVHGSATLEATRSGWKDEPMLLTGTLTDTTGRKDEFKGRQEEKSKTLTITHLSGHANLLELASNIPALASSLPHGVKVTTFPNIDVEDFVWQVGSEPVHWTLASLHLRSSAALIVMVREHPLTVDHLLGKISFDHHAWHFDHLSGQLLGGQFALSSSYDGKTLHKAELALQSLHLAALEPWLGKVSAKLQDAEMSLTYQGVLGNDPSNSTGSGTLDLVHAPVIHVPLLDQAYQLFPKILTREHRDDTGEVKARFAMTQGVAMVEPMKVIGQSVVVTARGKVDLNKRTVEGHARANIRGLAGVVIAPISVVFLEMKVVGPFEDIDVSPLGPLGAAKSFISGAVKLSSTVLRTGASVPFEALGMFRKEGGKSAE